jgi:glycosyltransferase involved in cell wall biosynthesis
VTQREHPPVLVVGAHWDRGPSMRRYTDALHDAYNELGVSVRTVSPSRRLSARSSRPGLRKAAGYIEQLLLFPIELILRRRRGELLHFADHSDALLALLFPRRWTVLVTCHDLIAVRAAKGEIPEHRARWSGRIYQRLVLAGLRRARLVLAVSRATETDVKRLVSSPPTVVVPVPLAPAFEAAGARGPREPAPYVIVVSGSGYRKRREHAVRTWLKLRQTEALCGTHLLIVGPPLEGAVVASVPAEAADQLKVVAGVTDEELARLYRRATALLQVSRYEGFGWPIVEANACGTPALCSESEVFREVGGDAAVFVSDDLDREDWERVARELTEDGRSDRAWENSERFGFKTFVKGLEAAIGHGSLVGDGSRIA